MKNNEKTNSFSLSTLVIALSGAPFWGILTSYMIHISKTASLISMLIGFVLSLILSLIFLKFFGNVEKFILATMITANQMMNILNGEINFIVKKFVAKI